MPKLVIVVAEGWGKKYREINMETGVIDGYSRWIFLGLSHVKKNSFIPREKITKELVDKMFNFETLFYQNGKCQWLVRDLDCGTTREWRNRPLRIFFKEEKNV
jgi:hypothetical protein